MALSNGRGPRGADDQVLEAIFNPEMPAGGIMAGEEQEDEGEVPVEDSDEVKQAKALEIEGVKTAEQGKLEEALSILTEAITIASHYPSPYNNRAQVYRLQNKVDLALKDLDSAVSLSGGRGRAAEQAYTQRGLIYRLHGNDDAARHDFQEASKLGSKFAQKQLVQMNPYSALCSQMLSEVFDKVKRGEAT